MIPLVPPASATGATAPVPPRVGVVVVLMSKNSTCAEVSRPRNRRSTPFWNSVRGEQTSPLLVLSCTLVASTVVFITGGVPVKPTRYRNGRVLTAAFTPQT